MYLISNITTLRDKGAVFHLPDGFSPESHTFGFEPWIAGMQLKLNETRTLTDVQYNASLDFINQLVKHHIVEVQHLPEPKLDIPTPQPDKSSIAFDLDIVEDAPILEPKEEEVITPIDSKKKTKNANR